ncbi:hypothetical protein PR001_g29607, partial [Phytophthora rubi]
MKRKHDEPVGARKRRRVSSRYPMETASSLGGVAVFKDVWGALVKAGWTSKRQSSKCLDTRYKYIRPGGRHDGAEGVDYLLGELAVLRYIEDLRVSEVPAEDAAPGTSQEVVAGCGAGERGARGRGAGGRHGGRTARQGVEAKTSGVGDSVGVSEDVQINKVRVQSGQTAYLPLDLLLVKLFLTLCVLVVQVLKPKLVGLATTSAWAQVVRPTRQASLGMVCEGVVVRQEDAQINKVRVQPAQSAYLRSDLLMKLFLTLCELVVQVLNLTAVGCGTALAWTPVARLVRQALLQGVREGVAHEGAVQERVVQEGVARQEDVEDARL